MIANKIHCLLVDDEPISAERIAKWVKAMGHACDIVGTADAARKQFKKKNYTYAVVDVKLKLNDNDNDPDTSTGRGLLISLHTDYPDLPILMVTAHVDNPEFSAELVTRGAYGFILKTSGGSKFQEKVGEMLKKHSSQTVSPPKYKCKSNEKFDLIVDENQPNLMILCGKSIDLTAGEFKFICFFAKHPNDRLTNERIMKNVWGDDFVENQRIPSVKDDIHKKIKNKIRGYDTGKFIVNIRKAGWMLNIPSEKVKFTEKQPDL